MKITIRPRSPRVFSLFSDVPEGSRRFHESDGAPTITILPLSRENLVAIQDSVMMISMSQSEMGGDDKNINIKMRSHTVNYNKIVNSIMSWNGFADANGNDLASTATSLANKKMVVDALSAAEYDALVEFVDNNEDTSNLLQ